MWAPKKINHSIYIDHFHPNPFFSPLPLFPNKVLDLVLLTHYTSLHKSHGMGIILSIYTRCVSIRKPTWSFQPHLLLAVK